MVGQCGNPIRNAMCSMLVGTLDTAISKIRMARDTVRAKVRLIERQLRALVPSSIIDIQNAIDAINDFEIPRIDTIDNLTCMATFIEGCSYLKNSPFGNVAAITNRLATYFNQDLQSDLNSLFPNLEEFSISWDLSISMDFTSGLGINTIVSEFNQLTQCITSFCNVDIQSRLDNMTSVLSDMSLTSDGELDIETIMVRSSITSGSRDAIRNILSAINSKKSEILSTMSSGVEATRGQDYSSLVTEYLFESELDFEVVIVGADLIINRVPLEKELSPLSIISDVSAYTLSVIICLSSICSSVSLVSGVLSRGTSEILTSSVISTTITSSSMTYINLALNSTCNVISRVEPRLTVT